MKKLILSVSLFVLCAANLAEAQSNSCRADVSRAKSALNRAIATEKRLQNQVVRDENSIVNIEGQREMALAMLRGKEEAAKADRNLTTIRCVAEVLITGRFCPSSGRNCVTQAGRCGLLAAMFEQQVQRLTAQRRAREKSYNGRISSINTRLTRNRSSLSNATRILNQMQNQYDSVAQRCGELIQLQACITRETTSCRQDVRRCSLTRRDCRREAVADCKLVEASQRNQCMREQYAICDSTYRTCSKVNCNSIAKETCSQ